MKEFVLDKEVIEKSSDRKSLYSPQVKNRNLECELPSQKSHNISRGNFKGDESTKHKLSLDYDKQFNKSTILIANDEIYQNILQSNDYIISKENYRINMTQSNAILNKIVSH